MKRIFLPVFFVLYSAMSLAGNTILEPAIEAEEKRWYFNPSDCHPDVIENIRFAADIISFYSPVNLKYSGETDAEITNTRDGKNTLGCIRQDNFVISSEETVLATTSFRSDGTAIFEADINFVANYFKDEDCTYLHELSHFIGLAHSDDPESIVHQGNNCEDKWLYADDLVTIAELYDVPANCTPYSARDMSIYFPNIGGFWVELRPINPDNISQGFYPYDFGKSITHNWQCNLFFNDDFSEIETQIFRKGNIIDIVLLEEDGLWYLEIK